MFIDDTAFPPFRVSGTSAAGTGAGAAGVGLVASGMLAAVFLTANLGSFTVSLRRLSEGGGFTTVGE